MAVVKSLPRLALLCRILLIATSLPPEKLAILYPETWSSLGNPLCDKVSATTLCCQAPNMKRMVTKMSTMKNLIVWSHCLQRTPILTGFSVRLRSFCPGWFSNLSLPMVKIHGALLNGKPILTIKCILTFFATHLATHI